MAHLNITDLKEIEVMTFTEYSYRMYALEYQRLKEEHDRYKLAFAIRDAQATKNVGTKKEPKEEYVFKNANDILDYSRNVKRLDEGKEVVFEGHEPVEPKNRMLFDIIADINNES